VASTELGPLSSKDALDTLSRQVEEAVKNGATLHVGGKSLESKGNFFEPNILTNITRDKPEDFEELFGPVAQM
ncbi:aldehyde dehydrogenase family protein, partial [Salmonella enterica]|uniref:aldehyde dehydrogenase family protein n=1 Tax=Salmonella enterica TaxID=28901 RepID=UPI003297D319